MKDTKVVAGVGGVVSGGDEVERARYIDFGANCGDDRDVYAKPQVENFVGNLPFILAEM